MKRIVLIVTAITALIAIGAVTAYYRLWTRPATPAKLQPIPAAGGRLTCFHIDIPANFKIKHQDTASCRLTLASTDDKYDVATFVRTSGAYGDLSQPAAVAKATAIGEGCEDPQVSTFQPGVLKSVAVCPQHTSETYIFKSKESKLQAFSTDPKVYLFLNVVTRDPAAPLLGDQAYSWLKK